MPADFRENSDCFYAPGKVSFGPYHHGRASCKSTEDIKKDVVCYALVTSKKTIRDYVEPLRKVLKDLKEKYDDLDQKWQEDDEAFLQLMIFDGCFLLEVLRAASDNISDSPVWDIDGVSPDKLMEGYRHDMLLLENQLPMLVLEKLYDVPRTVPATATPSIPWMVFPGRSTVEKIFAVRTDEAVRFIREKIQKPDPQENLNTEILKFVFPRDILREKLNVKPTKNCWHVLDLYRHSLLTQELRLESRFQHYLRQIMNSPAVRYIYVFLTLILLFLFAPVIWIILALVDFIHFPLKLLIHIFKTQQAKEFHLNIPSAKDLNEVGIGLTSKMKSLRDISCGRRILRLPQFSVDKTTESIFLNLIAFEKLHENVEHEVTSYIYFLSRLIKDCGDVHHLQRCGVIDNRLHTHGDIVKLFESLTKHINVHDPDSFVVQSYRDAIERLTNSFHKMDKPWRKDLWQTYLRSPWAFVSILAAFLLFSLTTVQTAYSVMSYYNSK